MSAIESVLVENRVFPPPEGGFDEMPEFDPEMKDIHPLRHDQAEVQRQLQPAAGKDQVGQGAQGRGFFQDRVVVHQFRGRVFTLRRL